MKLDSSYYQPDTGLFRKDIGCGEGNLIVGRFPKANNVETLPVIVLHALQDMTEFEVT